MPSVFVGGAVGTPRLSLHPSPTALRDFNLLLMSLYESKQTAEGDRHLRDASNMRATRAGTGAENES